MPHPIAERLIWAVETLDVQPDDRILEIGCGAGVAVSLICPRLRSGSITAIDRSPAMVGLAERRNQAAIASGAAVIRAADLATAELEPARFDKVFAINVALFNQRASEDSARIRELLVAGGALYLFHQPPVAWKTQAFAETTAAALRDHGFAIQRVLFADLAPVPAAAIIASVAGNP